MFLATLSARVCLGALRIGNECAPLMSRAAARSLSTAPLLQKEPNKPLKEWTFEVSPFSKVDAKLRCDFSVRPLDPHEFPEADRVFISVQGTQANEVDLENLLVHYNNANQELLINGERVPSELTVELTAPIKSDLFITVSDGGNVNIQKMESDVCKVQTERGNCVLASLRSHNVNILSAGGTITGHGTIHGNVDICAKAGSEVNIKKIQGSFMNVSTEQGSLKVKAIYAESSKMLSSSGNIQLGHIHGDASVESETGNVVVDSSSGALKVLTTSGNVDAYVGDMGSAEFETQQGSVSVRIPESMTAEVNLSGSAVEINPAIKMHDVQHDSTDGKTTVIGHLNGLSATKQQITVKADKGTVNLRNQSWFESLKLEK